MKSLSPRLMQSVDGLLLLDKPRGLTSTAALSQAKRLLRAKKAGHGGTLDPLATGLLPLVFGEATKFARFSLDSRKTYRAEIRLGITTDTGDSAGFVLSTEAVPLIEGRQLLNVLQRFVGNIRQVPPMFSALKRNGRPLYEYARAGVTLERSSREVSVDSIDLLAFASPRIWLRVTCGKGTYIRTLASDIGVALGCGAHLFGLRRERVGTLSIEQAVSLSDLEKASSELRVAALLPVETLLSAKPSVTLEDALAARLLQGQHVPCALNLTCSDSQGEEVLVKIYHRGRLLGLACWSEGVLIPKRLVAFDPMWGGIPTHGESFA